MYAHIITAIQSAQMSWTYCVWHHDYMRDCDDCLDAWIAANKARLCGNAAIAALRAGHLELAQDALTRAVEYGTQQRVAGELYHIAADQLAQIIRTKHV